MCKYNPEKTKHKVETYRVPLVKTQIDEGVFHMYSKTFKTKKVKDERVMMLISGTGVGKTTLINRIINYLFGIKYSDSFRFQLINEHTGLSETESQTKDIQIYSEQYDNIPYTLSIIYTPVFILP